MTQNVKTITLGKLGVKMKKKLLYSILAISLYSHSCEISANSSINHSAAVNPLTAKLFNLNFHTLEVVSR